MPIQQRDPSLLKEIDNLVEQCTVDSVKRLIGMGIDLSMESRVTEYSKRDPWYIVATQPDDFTTYLARIVNIATKREDIPVLNEILKILPILDRCAVMFTKAEDPWGNPRLVDWYFENIGVIEDYMRWMMVPLDIAIRAFPQLPYLAFRNILCDTNANDLTGLKLVFEKYKQVPSLKLLEEESIMDDSWFPFLMSTGQYDIKDLQRVADKIKSELNDN